METYVLHLDYTVISVVTNKSHPKKLKMMFRQLKGAKTSVNIYICALLKDQVKSLGHVDLNTGICSDSRKLLMVNSEHCS